MARIRSTRKPQVLRVTVTGRLTRADMGRLERACSPALVSNPPNLELDLGCVTFVDATARAVIDRIERRGALVTHPPCPPPDLPTGEPGAVKKLRYPGRDIR